MPALHAQIPANHPHREQIRWRGMNKLVKIFRFIMRLSPPKEWLREKVSTSHRQYSQQLLPIRTSRCFIFNITMSSCVSCADHKAEDSKQSVCQRVPRSHERKRQRPDKHWTGYLIEEGQLGNITLLLSGKFEPPFPFLLWTNTSDVFVSSNKLSTPVQPSTTTTTTTTKTGRRSTRKGREEEEG